MYTKTQIYKTIKLKLITRKDYNEKKAKRYTINDTNQNVWIPNKHLSDDGKINLKDDLDYIFNKIPNQLRIAGNLDSYVNYKNQESYFISEMDDHNLDKHFDMGVEPF